MSLIVADSSALVALASCECLSVLEPLFGTVRVPPAVFGECTVEGKPHATTLEAYLQDKISHARLEDFILSGLRLGRGEVEAMALYRAEHADRLLVDDFRARKVALLNRFRLIGTVGVLIEAKQRGLIATIKPRVEDIDRAGFYLNARLIQQALAKVGES